MSKRLHALLPQQEMGDIRRLAKGERVSVGERVRRALRDVCSRQPAHKPETKLEFVPRGARYSFPTADLDQMLGEIERGYQSFDAGFDRWPGLNRIHRV